MLTPRQNSFSPTVSDSPAWNVDTGPCCPQWEVRGTLPHNTAVWVGSITQDIFRWWYSTCKHLKKWIGILRYGDSACYSACRFCLWKKINSNPTSLKLAAPIEFLVSLLCRLNWVCKAGTLNNHAPILAVEEEHCTQLRQSITLYETQTDSPNAWLFKTSSLSGQNH